MQIPQSLALATVMAMDMAMADTIAANTVVMENMVNTANTEAMANTAAMENMVITVRLRNPKRRSCSQTKSLW